MARNILARYTELNKLAWEWHVEEYSMGHGTYLESEYLENGSIRLMMAGIVWETDFPFEIVKRA